MILNWIGYTYSDYDGYGRYGSRMIRALRQEGVEVRCYVTEQVTAPQWMRDEWGFDPSHLTISCLPPYYAVPIEGRHWLLSMTEGSQWPDTWDQRIYQSNAERVITPSEYNAAAVRSVCPDVPVHVVHGGTDPDEFPLRSNGARANEPYTFLALADRGTRKGWPEVYEAFWKAFRRAEDTPDVRLIIKARPVKNPLLDVIAQAENSYNNTDAAHIHLYPNIEIWREDMNSPREIFERCDVFAAPSRAEGWGMPHREAAMMGVPVITQRYSGLDDGYTEQWSLPIEQGVLEPIPTEAPHIQGDWMRPNIDELAGVMRWCYDNRKEAAERGYRAAEWLRRNQTWRQTAFALIGLMKETGVWH